LNPPPQDSSRLASVNIQSLTKTFDEITGYNRVAELKAKTLEKDKEWNDLKHNMNKSNITISPILFIRKFFNFRKRVKQKKNRVHLLTLFHSYCYILQTYNFSQAKL